MDVPDDWDMELNIDRYKETFDRVISFAKDHPDALWCYGNHDVSYLWGRLESGYSPCFKDFIGLILACGSSNPIEQIVWMNKEQFEQHMKAEKAIRTDTQNKVLQQLKIKMVFHL